MPMIVPFAPPLVVPGSTVQAAENDVRIATPVRGQGQWRKYAQAVNWLRGHGSQVFVSGPIGGMPTAGNNALLPLYYWPQGEHAKILWIMTLKGGIESNGFVDTASDRRDWSTSAEDLTPRVFFIEAVGSTTSNEPLFEMNTNTGSDTPELLSLVGVQLPNGWLSQTTGEEGVSESSCVAGLPIQQATNAKASVHGVAEELEDAKTEATRSKMFDWVDVDGHTGTASTPEDMFNIDPAIQTRHLSDSATTRTVTVAVRALCTGGDETGNVRCAMTNGDSVTIAISGASAAWYTGTMDIETDDFSRPGDLIRGGSRDSCNIDLWKTGTTTSITVYAVAIGES